MKKAILTLLIVAITTISYAQVAITTDGSTPDNSAMLDIKNTEKGILIPRMTAAERDAIVDPANGLLVYVTNDDSFYYNAGTTATPNWKAIGDWSTFGPYLTYNGGNVGIGTNAANEKLTVDGNIRAFEKVISGYGSTNDAAYRFGMGTENTGFSSPVGNTLSIINNGTESVRIKSNGNVGIGTSNPSTEFEVAGQVKITGGNPGNGKVLTSDGDGLASWEDTSGASSIDDLTDAKTNVGSVFLGTDAGINDDNINYNTGIGQNSLKTNTSGDKNTALGYASLYLNTTGKNNSAFGYDALNHNITGNRNTANGTYSLYSNETGSYNTAQGYGSMYKNTSGNYNVAIGLRTLYKNTDKSNLVAIGDSALFWNGTGANNIYEAVNNTAIGSKALYSNTIGRRNTAVGFLSLQNNTEGDFNTGIGNSALNNNSIGDGNTSIGSAVMANNTTGDDNTAIGFGALYLNQIGSENVAIGRSAGNSSTGNSNIFIGNRAGYNETGSNKLYIDNSDTSNPLIFGDFSNDSLRINGKLSVDGNITTSDNYIFDSPKIFALNISPAEIHPQGQDDFEYAYWNIGEGFGDTYVEINNTGWNWTYFMTPIHLPHDAIITSIKLNYSVYVDTEQSVDIALRLKRYSCDTQVLESIGSIYLDNFSTDIEFANAYDNSIDNAQIDNFNYHYALTFNIYAVNSSVKIHGVRITYTLDHISY